MRAFSGPQKVTGFFIKTFLLTIFIFVFSSAAFSAKPKLPTWVSDAVKQKNAYGRFDGDADALMLHRSEHITFGARGEVKTRFRQVVHIKTRDERGYAQAVIPVSEASQKVQQFNAWILYPSGKVESFKKSDLYQLASNLDALYSESSNFILDKTDSVRNDVVFAYEYELTERTVYLQSLWFFQSPVPTVYSQVSVEVPKGWSCKGQLINNANIEFAKEGNVSTWVARDLPGVKDELARPPATLLYSQVGISVEPTEGARKAAGLKSFSSWKDLAIYGAEVQEEGLVPNEAIRKKAKELTQSANGSWETIQAICEYAQSINYVMIVMDLNSGGGYKPHDAVDVFKNHYGDCKDMTVLARSLLQSVGIDSFAVIASIGREKYVHEEWASPMQFNHCILGVPVEDDIDVPAVVDHPQHGRILIFDPTQRFTPIGYLPNSLQGTRVLVASYQSDGLTVLPRESATENSVVRDVTVALDSVGNLSGIIKEELSGSVATFFRGLYRNSSKEDYEKFLAAWLSGGARDAKILSVTSTDHFGDNRFDLEIEFSAPRYARLMGSELLVFNPVFLSRHEWVPPVEEERTAEYVFPSGSLVETIRFTLPEGFAVDAISVPVAGDTSFVSYELSSTVEAGDVVVNRKIETRFEVIPAIRYSELVEYFENLTRSENSPVVLAKQ